ncbi:MAG: hypothetical protein ACXWIU_03010 [Limisphaerales bacterium]
MLITLTSKSALIEKSTKMLVAGCSILAVITGTGCVSVATKNAAIEPLVKQVETAKTDRHALLAVPAAAAASFAFQTLTPQARAANAAKVRNELKVAGWDRISAVEKLVHSAETGEDVKLSNGEIKDLGKIMLDTLHQNIFSGSARSSRHLKSIADLTPGVAIATENSAKEVAQPSIDVFDIVETYFVAYANGKFTLRDGTLLGKPTAKLTMTNGTITGSIPNDTVDGVVTILSESIADAICRTPVFYDEKTTKTYTNYWVPASEIYGTNVTGSAVGSFAQLANLETKTEKDFFLQDKVPTASKLFPCVKVVKIDPMTKKKSAVGLRREEAEFIRAACGLTTKQSQALATLIFQTFGGASAGQFVFLHFSVGNSQMLSSIVANVISSAGYHTGEAALTKAFLNYDGSDRLVEELLAHYQDILKLVSK